MILVCSDLFIYSVQGDSYRKPPSKIVFEVVCGIKLYFAALKVFEHYIQCYVFVQSHAMNFCECNSENKQKKTEIN